MTKLNGKYLSWGDISIQLQQGTLLDVNELDYSDEVGINRSQGAGRGTRGYSQGQHTGSGSVGMRREEYNRLVVEAKKAGGFYNLPPFSITVSYKDKDGKTITDTLEDCVFKKRDFKAAEKDEFVDVKVEFEILGQVLNDGVPAYKD